MSIAICYRWTLLIDELDYARTLEGNCHPSGSTLASSYDFIEPPLDQIVDATVAKLYILNQTSTEKFASISCLMNTVQKALKKQGNINNTL